MFRFAYRIASFTLLARAVDLALKGKPFALLTRVGMTLLRTAARNEERGLPPLHMTLHRPKPQAARGYIRVPPGRWDDRGSGSGPERPR